MFINFFNNKEVLEKLKEISSRLKYQDVNIPISISGEKMDVRYYSLLMFIDSLFKYYIIINSEVYLSPYLEQVSKLLKRVENHNDIKLGINKILINFCRLKLGLENSTSIENKKIILDYFYKSYIKEGYLFHSFPSVFLDNVKTSGLLVNNYYTEIESLRKIEKIFNKYKKNNIFFKELDIDSPYIPFTDSPFLGSYYAYYSPQFLNDFITVFYDDGKHYDTSAFFRKDYDTCKKNIERLLSKTDMFKKDVNEVLEFLKKEWDYFKINSRIPVMCMIKRKVLNKDSLPDYESLEKEILNNDISAVITKLLDTRLNNEKSFHNIEKDDIEIIALPTIEELNIIEKQKVTLEKKDNSKFINQYGNTTIIALLGILFITLGLTIMTILVGM